MEEARIQTKKEKEKKGRERERKVYSNIGLIQPPFPLNIILTYNPITIMHALPTAETSNASNMPPKRVSRIVRIEYIDAVTSIILGPLIRGKDLDGLINS